MQRITIYTDGSCNSKTGYGGYGVYLVCGDYEQVKHRGYRNTTTPRMEMRALLNAIRMVDPEVETEVTVKADSQFIVKAFKEGWLNKWRTAGFIGVKNYELWQAIIRELAVRRKMRFNIEWLAGHQKDLDDPDIFGNNVADALADYKSFTEFDLDQTELINGKHFHSNCVNRLTIGRVDK